MDEAVLASVLGRDEPETLVVVEPLHGSRGTHATVLPVLAGALVVLYLYGK